MNTSRLNNNDGSLLLRLKESKLDLKSTLSFEVNEIKHLKRDLEQSLLSNKDARTTYFFNKLDIFFDRISNDLERFCDKVEVEILNSSEQQHFQYSGLMELKFSQENNFNLLREQINNLKLKNELLMERLNSRFSSMSRKMRKRKIDSSQSDSKEKEVKMIDKSSFIKPAENEIIKEDKGTQMDQQPEQSVQQDKQEKNKRKIREMKERISKYEEVS